MEKPELLPLPAAERKTIDAVAGIYHSAFANDERVPFESLRAWLARTGEANPSMIGAFVLGRKVIGMGSVVFFRSYRIGYLPYLAIRNGLRGGGYGSALVTGLFEWVRERALETTGQEALLVFWDVRDPDEVSDEAEKVIRRRRIAFYRRLGGEVLPIEYTYPPVSPGQPSVRSLLMARTFPAGIPLSRKDALDVARLAVVEVDGEDLGGEHMAAALASVDAHWPE
jgi:ribosomal protein S18 acetylase RimI-like enzyme